MLCLDDDVGKFKAVQFIPRNACDGGGARGVQYFAPFHQCDLPAVQRSCNAAGDPQSPIASVSRLQGRGVIFKPRLPLP